MAIEAIAEVGSNLLIPAPGFSIYETICGNLDVEARHYRLDVCPPSLDLAVFILLTHTHTHSLSLSYSTAGEGVGGGPGSPALPDRRAHGRSRCDQSQ
jgi:tyrosine aminotransferase